MEMIEGLKTCRDKVKVLMEKYPMTRDSDKLLWLAYMVQYHDLREKIGNEAYLALKEIVMSDDTPPMESIRRIRQKIQETELQGKLQEERKEQTKEVTQWAKTREKKVHTFQLQT